MANMSGEEKVDRPKRVDFRFGKASLALEIPPFFVNFEKRRFKSIMVRKKTPPHEGHGILFYVYVTRSFQPEKLLALKSIHPDIYIPEDFKVGAPKKKAQEEIDEFVNSLLRLEKTWPYEGNGIWYRKFDSFVLRMFLIIGKDRWTVRPAISMSGLRGFGVEIPVDTRIARDFKRELRENELEDVHDHVTTQHFHLKVSSLQRYIELAKKWDYYFSTAETWRKTVRIP